MKKLISTIAVIFFLISTRDATAQIVWARHPSNPVMPSTSYDWNNPIQITLAIGPSVLYDSSLNLYRMWFSSVTGKGGSTYCISIATSLDRINWYISQASPVLEPGFPGAFDADGVQSPEVIKVDSQYFMYYVGMGGGKYQTGVATSIDGLVWTKYSGNPVITVGPPGSWESVIAGPFGTVLKEDSVFKMWYGGYDGNKSYSGYATSGDGFTWEKYIGNPIFIPGPPGTWDSSAAGLEAVVNSNGTYIGMYTGTSDVSRRIAAGGLAYSTDGIHWTKYPSNPVFSRDLSGWDNGFVAPGTVLVRGDTLHMWYTGNAASAVNWQTGYATSALVPSQPLQPTLVK